MSLEDKLVPLINKLFGEHDPCWQKWDKPDIVFPSKHPEVGPIEIYDDGDEITIVVGTFTHGHFANYDDGISESERQDAIVKQTIEFLEAVFADQVVFWGSHETGGGWYHRDTDRRQTVVPVDCIGVDTPSKEFVWSGPLREQ